MDKTFPASDEKFGHWSRCVFDHVHGTHFAHENGPTTHKMIIKKGPIPQQKTVFSSRLHIS